MKSEVIGNVKFYSADRSSKQFLIEKKLFNIKSLHSSKLIDYIINEYDDPSIVIFGSFSKGEDIEGSDIDIFVESSRKDIKIPESYEKKLKRNIHLFLYKKISDVKNKELANNIMNGVTLNGFIEVYG